MSVCTIPSPLVRETTGCELLHPGGLELTSRAIDVGAFHCGERVLDVGCGCGTTVPLLAQSLGVRPAGIDLRLPALQDGQARFPGVSLACARAQQLPFGAETWDGLLAECSLSTMPNLALVLAECRRVLVQGGRLVISDLYRRAPTVDPGQATLLDQPGWLAQLESHGFSIRMWEDHTQALKIWAARAILSGRPLDSLWGCCPPMSGDKLPAALSQLRLGYFLLVAQKAEA